MTARSIIIGVGETTWGDGVFPRLAGVSHDVEAMEYQLAKSGYKLPIVPTGTALQADCIAQSLGDLVSSTGPGDQLVIYLSGHGYEVADANDDDGDGWDEAFVCADRPILDDWFRDTLWREARPGARIVAVVDACHSRSIFKGAVGPPRITPTN